MLPIRTRSIFRSRWIALLWAAGICWTALQVSGGQSDKDAAADNGAAAESAEVNAALSALGQ